jgi:hypothetical protein
MVGGSNRHIQMERCGSDLAMGLGSGKVALVFFVPCPGVGELEEGEGSVAGRVHVRDFVAADRRWSGGVAADRRWCGGAVWHILRLERCGIPLDRALHIPLERCVHITERCGIKLERAGHILRLERCVRITERCVHILLERCGGDLGGDVELFEQLRDGGEVLRAKVAVLGCAVVLVQQVLNQC